MDAQFLIDDYGPQDTIGRLLCGERWWYILTRAKDDPDHPCLPLGDYNLTLGMHYGHAVPAAVPYPAWHIWNADYPLDREYEIHVGNTWKDSLGCLLIGTDRVTVNGVREVLHSAAAHTQWMGTMNGDPGTLTISEAS